MTQADNKSTRPTLSDIEKEILVAEYNYIANCAFQANEDRARVFQVFFGTFGAIIAALLTQPDNTNPDLTYAVTALFGISTLWGVSSLYQLTRLRSAWYDAILAMNQIKSTLIKTSPTYHDYFKWKTTKKMVPLLKWESISTISAIVVSILTGISFGTFLMLLDEIRHTSSTFKPNWYLLIGLSLASSLTLFISFYVFPLLNESLRLKKLSK